MPGGLTAATRRFLKEPDRVSRGLECFYWEKSWLERRLEAASRDRSPEQGAGGWREAGLRPVGQVAVSKAPVLRLQAGPRGAARCGPSGPSMAKAWACTLPDSRPCLSR